MLLCVNLLCCLEKSHTAEQVHVRAVLVSLDDVQHVRRMYERLDDYVVAAVILLVLEARDQRRLYVCGKH
jgi:hypothetical protein